jgi:hypothetical protein
LWAFWFRRNIGFSNVMSAPQGDHSPVTNTMVDEASQNLVSQPSDAFIGILIMGCRT